MTSLPNKPSRRGAILIEVIISTALLGSLFATVFLGLVTMNQLFRRTNQALSATTAIANQFDQVRALRYDGLLLGITNQTVATLPNGSLQMTITEPETDLKEVVVTISWFENGQSPRQVSAITRVTRDGLEAL